MKKYRTVPNALTLLRIVGAAALLAFPPESGEFLLLYVFCGLTDMADGFLARKLHQESRFGEKLDSTADIVFTIICLCKLIPVMRMPFWVWLWVGLIALCRVVAAVAGRGRLLHTKADKLAGLAVFLAPILWRGLAVQFYAVPICAIATYAAVDELLKNRKQT